ncbi:hypothetical protein SYNPS1DRAFT_31854 [Syncephalis pseudoplumigaleata]|uniref:GYF domain-containing protein n=1 Tax=Syncephalis pseudoplumigaleata TaxID=1712513 RepID=A0A4P9YRL5_9FUNG|nr:hypothetical protein SYNPS1DRAFT_31854 [Syncephalis pseudoplumigaleata]|eukprot:RKP22543.1 hypothetical protein SYNPS1DRAFT_31854 [Syncephalis pseudoplumigaleata]
MAANAMNFGPEWMRPAKPANAAAGLPAQTLAGPSRDHPAFKSSLATPRPKPTLVKADGTEIDPAANAAAMPGTETEPAKVKIAPPLDPLPPAPFRYTTEFMLSLFKPEIDIPESEFERHEVVLSEETLPPVATLPLTEVEEAVMASGSVNSDITRRILQQQNGGGRGGRGGSRGGRGGHRGAYNSAGQRTSHHGIGSDEGFRNFMSRAQISEEPAWTKSTPGFMTQSGALGHFDAQGVFHFENVAGADGRGGRSNSRGRLPDLAAMAAEFTLAQQAQHLNATGAGLPLENPEETLWFYRDPQGNIQGPFTGLDMHEWYKAGFFTANLLVKREGDADFEPLGQLVQILGNDEMPFLLPSPHHLAALHLAQSSSAAEQLALLENAGAAGWTDEAYFQELEREKDRVRQQMDRQRLVHVLQQRQGGPATQQPSTVASGQHISRGYQSDLLVKLNQQQQQEGGAPVDQLAASMSQLDVHNQ